MMRFSKRSGVPFALCIAAAMLSWTMAPASAASATVHKVGAITWHAARYVSQTVTVTGFMLARENGYVLFSDEATGKISSRDLPVTGSGIDQMQLTKKYLLQGQFVAGGLKASNGNPYHLQLDVPPQQLAP